MNPLLFQEPGCVPGLRDSGIPVYSGKKIQEKPDLMKHPELTDGFITLRRYTKKDADELFAAVRESLADMKPWLPFVHDDYSIKETRDWLKQRPREWKTSASFDFAITDAGDGTLLGGCGLNNIDKANRLANLGYWVRAGRGRQGIAPAATRLLAEWGLKKMKLKRIEILVAIDNQKSIRVAEKTGAHREGVLRNRLFMNGKPHDAVMFSIVAGEL